MLPFHLFKWHHSRLRSPQPTKVASKASRRLGILHRTKSFLGSRELLSTDMAIIHSLMEHCSSPLSWHTCLTPCSAWCHETKAFKIIGISHDKADSYGLITFPSQTGRWSLCLLLPPFLSCSPPHVFLVSFFTTTCSSPLSLISLLYSAVGVSPLPFSPALPWALIMYPKNKIIFF